VPCRLPPCSPLLLLLREAAEERPPPPLPLPPPPLLLLSSWKRDARPGNGLGASAGARLHPPTASWLLLLLR
jgi:hypothetical protein